MKDYKLLLAGLVVLTILFIAIFAWLWIHNRKNIDPLPIMSNEHNSATMSSPDDTNVLTDNVLQIQAEASLQTALDDIIISFESRYPNIQVLANYVAESDVLKLSDTNVSHSKPSQEIFDVDMIITNDKLTIESLSPLQAELNAAQDNIKQSKINTSNTSESAENSIISDNDKLDATESHNKEARTLNSFSYASRDARALEGVILTDNTAAISFRNFLLSSAGQDILKTYHYDNIEGYKNSINDLFNPTSRTQQVPETSSINVADALSNGEQ